METHELQSDYNAHVANALRLQQALIEQFGHLFVEHEIGLGVPMEGRVKSCASIAEKLERKALALASVTDLDDFIGIRVILLFHRDLKRIDGIFRDTLDVLTAEDTGSRLSETQFGYQSQHYIVRIPESWQKIPSFSGLRSLKAEVQVRTVAQHIWAAASHKLQYKQEQSVPPPLRRAIHRISALLEIVDSELDRLLEERQIYVEQEIDVLKPDALLNVDVIRAVLDAALPPANKLEEERYDALLADLSYFKIETAEQLQSLLNRQHEEIMRIETDEVRELQSINTRVPSRTERFPEVSERLARGVFSSHVGLVRKALEQEFGVDKWAEWRKSKYRKVEPSRFSHR